MKEVKTMTGANRRSRAIPEPRQTLKSDGKLGGFELPEGVLPNGEEWHPMTVEWWEAWRRSPQGVAMATDVDWRYHLDTALIHHQMWSKGRWEFANEVRMREAKFGATPADRAALKFALEISEEHEVGNTGYRDGWLPIHLDHERRKRLMNG